MANEQVQQAIVAAQNLQRAGRLGEAEAIYKKLIVADPNNVDAHGGLGAIYAAQGRLQESIAWFQRACDLDPNQAGMHYNLGLMFQSMGRHNEAIRSYKSALAINPNMVEAYNNLGNAYKDLGQLDEAIENIKHAQQLRPEIFLIAYNLGGVYRERGKLDESVAALKQAIKIKPDFAPAFNNLGMTLKDQGRINDAVACFRKALEFGSNVIAHSNLVHSLHYHSSSDPMSLLHELQNWSDNLAEPLKSRILPHPNDKSPDRKIRVGYISPDLGDHVVGRSLLPILSNHDPEKFETVCYADVARPDASTQQLREAATHWRSIVGLNDDQVAEIIRRDHIDILVDLSLHTAGNRLLVFARKPAPIQVTYLGYCSTSGMSAMDYRLTDPHIDPPDSDLGCYRESTMRLSKTYWCYQPGGPAPDVAPLPALKNGYITFGCLNNFCKVSPQTLDAWGEILKSLPTAKLLVHSLPGSHRESVVQRLLSHGATESQIEFADLKQWAGYIETYSRIDIGLDPFPYNGGITTCDSLYMGVPVISLAGRTAVGRGGKSILTNIGLPQLVATNVPDYVRRAIKLAADVNRLAAIRSTMRKRIESSPLMNATDFTRDLESIFRTMWETWCEN